jgi:hypothetical protein
LWRDPLFAAANYGFNGKEFREISVIIEENENIIRDKWNEHIVSLLAFPILNCNVNKHSIML